MSSRNEKLNPLFRIRQVPRRTRKKDLYIYIEIRRVTPFEIIFHVYFHVPNGNRRSGARPSIPFTDIPYIYIHIAKSRDSMTKTINPRRMEKVGEFKATLTGDDNYREYLSSRKLGRFLLLLLLSTLDKTLLEPQSTLATDDACNVECDNDDAPRDGEPLGSRIHKYTRPEIVCTAARKLEGRALVDP